jgi:hypothetical protein
MHIGKETLNCPNLEVNGLEMKSTNKEKYLGDVISCSGKMDDIIQMRYEKGMGIINSIMSILKEISFGQHYFEIGMLLRTTMLINGILFNLEACNNLSTNQINLLEECDKKLLRRIFDTEQGTPVESFYLETSVWPLRHILMARKLMYYWTLLHKSESELCKQVFNAQQEFPTEGSWTTEVQGVLKSCNITYTSDQISKMTNTKFKNIVKEKIQSKVLVYLVTLQNKHTKSEKLHLENKMQPYLRTNELSLREKKFLFILRSKMLKLKANFSSMYGNNLVCSLCTEVGTVESESHLLNCSVLMENTAVAEEMKQVKYEDVFSDTKRQQKVVKVFLKIMNIFEKLKTQKQNNDEI